MLKTLFIINPSCGRQQDQDIDRHLRAALARQPARYSYDITLTEPDIAAQFRGRLSQYDTVIIVGGDGTFSQVVQAIGDLNDRPRLGLIPTGTGNDLAVSLGILQYYKAYGLAALLEALAVGKFVALDIMQLSTGRFFINYFGMGTDAKISNIFNRMRRNRFFAPVCRSFLAKPFYGALALQGGFYRIPFDITMHYRNAQAEIERCTIPRGICEIIVSNVKTYAGGILLSSGCRMDDGRFEVTVIAGLRQWLALLPALLFHKPLNTLCPNLLQFQTDWLELTCSGRTFYQVDGELLDGLAVSQNSLTITASHQIQVLVPSV